MLVPRPSVNLTQIADIPAQTDRWATLVMGPSILCADKASR